VLPFDGDLDEYQRIVLSDASHSNATPSDDRSREPRANRAEVRRAAAEKRVELAPMRKRITNAEAAIAKLNQEIAKIDAALADPGLFARDPARAATLAKSRADAARALASAEDEWLEASTAYESAMP
jgi:ATP-binding cassette subfamily F protein 3